MKTIWKGLVVSLTMASSLFATADTWICFPDEPPTDNESIIVVKDLIVYLTKDENTYKLSLSQSGTRLADDLACVPKEGAGIATTMFMTCDAEEVAFDSANNRGSIQHIDVTQTKEYAQQPMLCRNMSALTI